MKNSIATLKPGSICRVLLLTGFLLGFSLPALGVFALESGAVSSGQRGPDELEAGNFISNPLERALIRAIPGSDGREIFITVSGVDPLAGPLFVQVEAECGFDPYQIAYPMTQAGGSYLATISGLPPGRDCAGTIRITATAGSERFSSDDISPQKKESLK